MQDSTNPISVRSVARTGQNGKFDKSGTNKWYTGIESDIAIKMQNWRCKGRSHIASVATVELHPCASTAC